MGVPRLPGASRKRPPAKRHTGPGLKELAARIGAHLQRFEADPQINAENPKDRTRPYYHARAVYAGGPRIHVCYVSYQGTSTLTRQEATAYLAWLDAGHAGRHYAQQRQAGTRR